MHLYALCFHPVGKQLHNLGVIIAHHTLLIGFHNAVADIKSAEIRHFCLFIHAEYDFLVPDLDSLRNLIALGAPATVSLFIPASMRGGSGMTLRAR